MKTTISFLAVLIVCLAQSGVNGAAIADEIYNGYDAVRGQFPYQTLHIQQGLSGGSSSCGGSLISTQWVMTAAHCAYQVNYTRVYVGLVNTADGTGVSQYTVPKANHYVHPQYNPNTLQNDIALLKLPKNVTTNQYVGVVKLPKMAQANSSTFDNRRATASGWGKTRDNEQGIHQILQYRTINVYAHSQCVNYYRNVNTVTNGMICTDKRVVYAGPCQGDSGGPLTVNGTDGRPVAIGAVSWGVGNCSNTNPVVFTNVAYYLKWINSVSGIAVS